MARRIDLTELEAEMLMKIGEKYEMKDGSFAYGAIARIKEDAAAFINLSDKQVRSFFHARRQIAKKYRGFTAKAGDEVQHIPIKMLYGYGGAQQPKVDPSLSRSFIQTQQKDLEEEFVRLKIKQDEIEKQREQMEETVTALDKVNEERDKLKVEIEDAHKHIASLKSEKEEIKDMLSVEAAKYDALKATENQNKKKLQIQIKEVCQFNRELKKKEEDLEARRSDLENDKQRLDQELKQKDHEHRDLRKKLDEIEQELERERLRQAHYNPWTDVDQLRRNCQELDKEVLWLREENDRVRSRAYYDQDQITYLKDELQYYKSQCETKRNAAAQDTAQYWYDKYIRMEYENKVLREEKRGKSINDITADIIDRAIMIDDRVMPIIRSIVDDRALREDVLRAGLLVKIRFLGQSWFELKWGIAGFYNYRKHIGQWDCIARKFLEFRNHVVHDWKYLKMLGEKMDEEASNYFSLYEEIQGKLNEFEHHMKDSDRMKNLGKVLAPDQIKDRLKELRLLNPQYIN